MIRLHYKDVYSLSENTNNTIDGTKHRNVTFNLPEETEYITTTKTFKDARVFLGKYNTIDTSGEVSTRKWYGKKIKKFVNSYEHVPIYELKDVLETTVLYTPFNGAEAIKRHIYQIKT